MITINIRFYEELNDFLPLEKRKVEITLSIAKRSSIKDVIESLGVPHTEIDLILVNGHSVDFTYKVLDNDFISVYPMFEALDISELTHVRPLPLRNTCFILDVHLGKLAKYLRLLGFDVIYQNNFSDNIIIDRSLAEKRIILTRDIGLLKNKRVTHGYWIRHTNAKKQVAEVLVRFDLYKQCQPFIRCLECNGILAKINKHEIMQYILPKTKKYYEDFVYCEQCKKIYWKGTHYKKLKELVNEFLIYKYHYN